MGKKADVLSDVLCEVLNEARKLSSAYVRLRHMIPGALDTPTAPTPEQVWEVTEIALIKMVSELTDARTEITRLQNIITALDEENESLKSLT